MQECGHRDHSNRQSGISRGAFLRRVGGGVATVAVAGAAAPDILLGAVHPPTGLTALALDWSVVLAWQPGRRRDRLRRSARRRRRRRPRPWSRDPAACPARPYTTRARTTAALQLRRPAIVSGGQSGNSNLVTASPRSPAAPRRGTRSRSRTSYPGTDAWKMQGAGTAADGPRGLRDPASINAGDSVDLKVNTADGAPYHIEIYRAGWYGGSQARLISTIPGLSGVHQDFPQKDPDLGLIDASNWTVTSTITTTTDWPSGVYLLRLARDDNAATTTSSWSSATTAPARHRLRGPGVDVSGLQQVGRPVPVHVPELAATTRSRARPAPSRSRSTGPTTNH